MKKQTKKDIDKLNNYKKQIKKSMDENNEKINKINEIINENNEKIDELTQNQKFKINDDLKNELSIDDDEIEKYENMFNEYIDDIILKNMYYVINSSYIINPTRKVNKSYVSI